MTPRVLFAVLCALAALHAPHLLPAAGVLAVLFSHLLLAAAVTVATVLAVAVAAIAGVVADCGWRVQPCRRRFAC